ncbi:MAG TPA: thiolase family protein, partial [Symbiobacteriaceae bacterium]|nr:thiolase family protein [Symbiobacteriaceae bacterium]
MEAYLIDAVRTPTGKKKGALSAIRGDELATIPVKALLERTGAPADHVEDLILGCVTPIGEQGWNLGRQIALLADLPLSVCGTTINRMCGSGLQAVHWAAQGIMSGTHDLIIAAGTEMMSRVPMGSDGGDWAPGLNERFEIIPQHLSAERIATKWGISRAESDQYALESHRRASQAWIEGRFAKEVIPAGGLATDETVRPGTTYEQMAGLAPLFPDGIIHAGVSSPICDGAAAALLASEAKVKEL